MSDPLKIFPADVRTSASDFCKMSEQARQIQDTLTRSWARLDAGWEDYAESGIQSYYHDAMDEISHMFSMLDQMSQALLQSADGIEAADKSTTALFTDQSGSQPGGGNGKPPGLARFIPFPDEYNDKDPKPPNTENYSEKQPPENIHFTGDTLESPTFIELVWDAEQKKYTLIRGLSMLFQQETGDKAQVVSQQTSCDSRNQA